MNGIVRDVLVASTSAALIVWILIAPIVWVLRDGLGPNATTSAGWYSIERFLTAFHYGPVLAALVALRWLLTRWDPADETTADRLRAAAWVPLALAAALTIVASALLFG